MSIFVTKLEWIFAICSSKRNPEQALKWLPARKVNIFQITFRFSALKIKRKLHKLLLGFMGRDLLMEVQI
jgi:hypothetical protein